jgi:hypothetical protein
MALSFIAKFIKMYNTNMAVLQSINTSVSFSRDTTAVSADLDKQLSDVTNVDVSRLNETLINTKDADVGSMDIECINMLVTFPIELRTRKVQEALQEVEDYLVINYYDDEL